MNSNTEPAQFQHIKEATGRTFARDITNLIDNEENSFDHIRRVSRCSESQEIQDTLENIKRSQDLHPKNPTIQPYFPKAVNIDLKNPLAESSNYYNTRQRVEIPNITQKVSQKISLAENQQLGFSNSMISSNLQGSQFSIARRQQSITNPIRNNFLPSAT